MRFKALCAISVLLWPISIWTQTGSASPVPLEKEVHHVLAFENDRVRLFHLQLQPNQITEAHRHATFYAYFSVTPVTISNEVAGRAPVITQLERGELRTSKGGFNVAERNISTGPADIFVVQPLKKDGDGFPTPVAFPMHNAGTVELYSGPTMRAYSLAIASGGRLDEHTEMYDSLVVAMSASTIREAKSGSGSTDRNWAVDEAQWIPKGTAHSEMNIGPEPAEFMVLEFN